MVGGLVTLGSAIISGISGYFKDKHEIKKVQVEADNSGKRLMSLIQISNMLTDLGR